MKLKKVMLIVFTLVLTSGSLHAENKLTFSAIKNSINTKISAKVMAEAYRRIGFEIVVEEYPGKRALFHANKGIVDGEMFRISGLEKSYPNLSMISVPINKLDGMVYTKKVMFKVDGWDSLKPYKVGVRRGIKFSDKGTMGMEPHVVNTNKELFEILDKGLVDIIVIARVNGLSLSTKFKNSDIRLLKPPIESYPLHHYLHKKNKHLIPELEAALNAMKKEGMIQKIRAQFLSEMSQ